MSETISSAGGQPPQIIHPATGAEPCTTEELGGFPVRFFNDPGVGLSPPPPDVYRDEKTGKVDLQAYAGALLKWTSDKTIDQGIILSALCRELVSAREERAELRAEVSRLRLEFSKAIGEAGFYEGQIDEKLAELRAELDKRTAD